VIAKRDDGDAEPKFSRAGRPRGGLQRVFCLSALNMDSPQVDSVRVRFGRSPAGTMHVGVAHTALFNWLFARKHPGTFILRIEDEFASDQGAIDSITDDLAWLGLDWNAIYFQSLRRHICDRQLLRLLATRGTRWPSRGDSDVWHDDG